MTIPHYDTKDGGGISCEKKKKIVWVRKVQALESGSKSYGRTFLSLEEHELERIYDFLIT